MKQLNQYISEKLKINKDSHIDPNEQPNNFLFVIAFNDTYDELHDNFEDAMVVSNSSEATGFILTKKVAIEFFDTRPEGEKDAYLYIIPKEYKTLADFEDAWNYFLFLLLLLL